MKYVRGYFLRVMISWRGAFPNSWEIYSAIFFVRPDLEKQAMSVGVIV